LAIREILIDTNAYAAFKRNAPEAVEIIRHAPVIGINAIVLGELLGGFAVGTREASNKKELKRFLDSKRVKLFSIGKGTASSYALVYKSLRQKGRPIPTNDMWIAATALQHELALFTYDAHFHEVEGLIIGNRLSDFIL
jgi:tRNA(fMet)-specific endonuclease VapC